jgi:hypothetical protein
MDAARLYVCSNISAIAKYKPWYEALSVYEECQVGGRERKITSRKVLGTLRAMWDADMPSAEDEYFMAQIMLIRADRERRVDELLGDYWEAYVSQLSHTVRAHLETLLLDRHEPGYVMSNAGKNDPETKGFHVFVDHLHRVWEHRDAVSRREMLALMREYLEVIPEPTGGAEPTGVTEAVSYTAN